MHMYILLEQRAHGDIWFFSLKKVVLCLFPSLFPCSFRIYSQCKVPGYSSQQSNYLGFNHHSDKLFSICILLGLSVFSTALCNMHEVSVFLERIPKYLSMSFLNYELQLNFFAVIKREEKKICFFPEKMLLLSFPEIILTSSAFKLYSNSRK